VYTAAGNTNRERRGASIFRAIAILAGAFDKPRIDRFR